MGKLIGQVKDGSRKVANLVLRGVRDASGRLLGGIVLDRGGVALNSSSATASRRNDQAHLICMMVHYNHQRQGIGKALLFEALESCARRSSRDSLTFSIDLGGCAIISAKCGLE